MVHPLSTVVPQQEDVSPSAVHRLTTSETAAGGGSSYGVSGRGVRMPGRGRVGRPAGRGRGGRMLGRGTGRGRGGEANPLIKELPASIRSCVEDGGWILLQKPNMSKCQIISESEYAEQYASQRFRETYFNMADSVSKYCVRHGIDNHDAAVFTVLLSNTAVEKIRMHTTQQLVKNGHHAVANISEMHQFFGTMFIRSRFRVSNDLFFDSFGGIVESKYNVTLMKKDRYIAILKCLRGYEVAGRCGDDDTEGTWFQKKNRLRKLAELEKVMFQPTLDIVMNRKCGEVVLDDELIGSRARDVNQARQTHSLRKAGKDGVVADCFACAHTGIMLGMRLRVVGETDQSNVLELCKRLPVLSSQSHDVSLKMDRGFGGKKNVTTVGVLGYSMSTIAPEIGSKTPFIYPDVAQDYITKLRNANDPNADAKIALFKEFVLDGSKYGGAQVSIAKTDWQLRESGNSTCTIYAYGIRDIYNKKTPVKHLRFFNTDRDVNLSTANVWVAMEKNVSIDGSYLFSARRPSINRTIAESKLRESCEPYTITQRTGDWFIGREMRFTGTVGSSFNDGEGYESDDDDWKVSMLDKCIDSWFGRHASSDVMRQGTENENYVLQRLTCEKWISDIFEVGMLQSKRGGGWLAVSPDAIAVGTILSPDGCFVEDDSIVMFVEIKTRQSPTTIEQTRTAKDRHGAIVYCSYGSDTFKDCVFSENRKQLLHQAMVTGLTYGVYVSAILVDGESEICQLVIVRFSDEQRDGHFERVNTIGRRLLGWLYHDQSLDRGYLRDDDFPDWLTDEQKGVFQSRYPMWCALYNKITTRGVVNDGSVTDSENVPTSDDSFQPMKPVSILKHYQQYQYNKSKWGLDKNTEFNERVLCLGMQLCVESLYILRMVNALAITTWRHSQSKVVKCFVIEYAQKNNEEMPSMEQIRKKLNNVTNSIDDWVIGFGADLLKYAVSHRFNAAISSIRTAPLESRQDYDLINYIDKEAQKGKWRITYDRLKRFSNDERLQGIRKSNSRALHHNPVRLAKSKGGKVARLNCALCSKTKGGRRQTRWQCGTCEVPLCCSTFDANDDEGDDRSADPCPKSCYKLWHEADNLLVEHEKQHALMCTSKQIKKRKRKGDDDNDGWQEFDADINFNDGANESMAEADGAWSLNGLDNEALPPLPEIEVNTNENIVVDTLADTEVDTNENLGDGTIV